MKRMGKTENDERERKNEEEEKGTRYQVSLRI